jgi:hypothetical protein
MTLPASGQIAVSQISTEIGQADTYSTSLNFLNGLIVAAQRPATPSMASFYSKAFFQNNTQGNCNNGNCTSNCNCGNIQCNNCVISGGVNCTNCDAQSWLQSNCNCACSYNCTTGATSYNCNCACNCSKIVCAKLFDLGMMSHNIWAADQAYGQMLRKTDKSVYRGYIRWARIVTAWMEGKGPDFMVWIKDKEQRQKAQQKAMISMANKIGQPWSQHMAYLMGAVDRDNAMGRVLMNIGRPICRVVDMIPRIAKSKRKHGLPTVYTIWFFLFFSYYTASTITKLNVFKGKLKCLAPIKSQ